MSGDNTMNEGQGVVPYEVGYGKPPKQHRFRKGQSGNPRGRARGSRNQPKVNIGFGMRPAEELLREEAYRKVTLREGGELIELPAIQAVFRAMSISALKGNRFAQRTLADLVTGLEARDAESRNELLSVAVEYKERWTEQLKRSEALGEPPPQPVPHPDDIIVNPRTGEVTIEGPQTDEERAHYDKALQRRDEAQEEVTYFARRFRQARSEQSKASNLQNWLWEQRMFDIINDALARRYKVKLKDRSFHPDASREGDTLRKFMKDRRKPPENRRWGDYVE